MDKSQVKVGHTTFVNLTPRPVRLFAQPHDTEPVMYLEAATKPLLLKTESRFTGLHLEMDDGFKIPIETKSFVVEEGSEPECVDCTVYIVLPLVAEICSHRRDFLCCDTGPDGAVRDKAGCIIGSTRLVTYAKSTTCTTDAGSEKTEETFSDPNAGQSFESTSENTYAWVSGVSRIAEDDAPYNRLVNLLPHAVVLADGTSQRTIPSNKKSCLRCPESTQDPTGIVNVKTGVPVVRKAIKPPNTAELPVLPLRSYYLVSSEVAKRLPQRRDFLAPGGGPGITTSVNALLSFCGSTDASLVF